MSIKVAYSTSATATGGGRNEGRSVTADGTLDVKLTSPKELGGPGGPGTNPEQLFAAGYSACFLGALRYAAGRDKIAVPADTSVQANVGIGGREDGTGFGLVVSLTITAPGLDPAVLDDLIQKAHVVCPYSHATRGNIEVTLNRG